MSNDVSLHFGSAGFDGISARSQVGVRPDPVVDSTRVAPKQLAVRTQQLLRNLLKALVELTPENLLNRALGTWHTHGGDAAESADLIKAHDLNFRAALRELLADEGVFGCGPPVALDGVREFDETHDETFEYEVQARAVRTPLMHQRAHRHIPSVIHLAQGIFHRDAHVAKKQLAEFGLAGHLTQGANFKPRRFHIHEENGQSFVLGDAGVGADDEFTPIAQRAVAGPHFLTVHDVVITVQPRFRLQTGQIGTRIRLREALAP